MPLTSFQISLWVELVAAALGGLQGALFAAAQRPRRIDVLGVIVLRDIVLNQPPVAIWMNWYLVVAATAAVFGMVAQPLLARASWVITALDAVVMGLFAAVAASKALSLGVGEVGSVVVGVIGAIGGGMLRDVVLNLPVSFLHVGTLYAVAAGAGAGVFVVLAAVGTPTPFAGVACVAVSTIVRLAAVLFGWRFPERWAAHPRSR